MTAPTAEQVARGVRAIRNLWLTCDCPPTPGQTVEAVLRTLAPRALAIDASEASPLTLAQPCPDHTCTCGQHVPTYLTRSTPA